MATPSTLFDEMISTNSIKHDGWISFKADHPIEETEETICLHCRLQEQDDRIEELESEIFSLRMGLIELSRVLKDRR